MHEISRLIYNEVRKKAKTLPEAAKLLGVGEAATRLLLSGEHGLKRTTWNRIEPHLPGFSALIHFPTKAPHGPRSAELTDEGIKRYNELQLHGSLPLYWEEPLQVSPMGVPSQQRYLERMRRLAQESGPAHRRTTEKKAATNKKAKTPMKSKAAKKPKQAKAPTVVANPIEANIGAGKEKIRSAPGGKVSKGIGYCGALLARLVRIPGMREDITMLDETLRNDGSSIAEALKMIP